MKRLALAAFAVSVLPGAASAQGGGNPSCKEGAMPFAATATNRLTGAALLQAVSGKRLVYIRESLRTPGAWVNNMRDYRADGSFVYICEFGRSADGPWRPCGSFGSVERRVAGARDVGVWSIKNDAVCAAKRVSGPIAVCMPGAITLQ